MRARFAAGAALLLALVTLGCGNGGLFSSKSPFEGTWSGTFTDQINKQTGTITDLTVTSFGKAAGVVSNTTTGASATINGTIVNSGTATLTYSFPTSQQSATGVLQIDPTGHMLGTLQITQNGSTVGAETIDLSKQ